MAMAMTVRELIDLMQDIGHLDDPVHVIKMSVDHANGTIEEIKIGPVVATSSGNEGEGPFNLVVSDDPEFSDEDDDE